jgi:metallo-beta-lactamase class B
VKVSSSLILFVAAIAASGFAQQERDPFKRPFPAFRIVGNLYYVGGYDLASYLIATPEGNILINTGLAETVPDLRANIEAAGFNLSDTKILAFTHAHWDHVAGMAEMKHLTGARLIATAADAALIASGGKTDFRFGADRSAWFEPVEADEKLKDAGKISLGGTVLTVHLHPGHTRGAASFTFDVADSGRTYHVLIANMPSINPGVVLRGNPKYPEIAADYARTFRAMKAITPEIWLASHAGQFHLHEKYKPGDPYRPERFIDPAGYRAALDELEREYLRQVGANEPRP